MAVLGLAACGGGGSSPATPPPPNEAPLARDLVLTGSHVVKVRVQGKAWIALAEKPRPHEDNVAPDRHLLLAPPGATSPIEYRPPADWSLIDAALHPSGEVSLVLATQRTLRLVRLSAQGQVVRDMPFVDPLAATDPMHWEYGSPVHDSGALLPFATRDAVRLAPVGEGLVMALRTGRHAAVAYGLQHQAAAGYAIGWRTLVEPGGEISAEGYLGAGTFDPFGSMTNQFQLALEVDATGQAAVAMSVSRTGLVYAHRQQFGQGSLPAAFAHGVLLTQLGADGRRLGTTVLDTGEISELHGLRRIAERWVLVGRVRSELREDGTGWNGYVATVAGGTHVPASYGVVDIDRGDVLFDAMALPDGRLLLAGSTGYWQNPMGRSVSESAAPLVVRTALDGSAAQRVAVAAGPRHNQVRALGSWGGATWIGGMEDGAGTHSDDADPRGLRSNGYLRALAP